MKVWRWSYETDKYDYFTLPKLTEMMEQYFRPYFDGSLIGDKWGEIEFETYRHGKIASDCTGIGDIPIFNERTVKALWEILENNVELLPLKHPTQNYYAVNVVRVIDALDSENSNIEYVEGHPNFVRRVNQYAFKMETIRECPIFKIPELKRLRVFVTDTFKEAVEVNGLKGFTFELLWDSEDSGSMESEREKRYQEMLAAIENNIGEEFSFQEAEHRITTGESFASGQWRLQQAPDGTVWLGNLQWDGSYNWLKPIYYPSILLDLKWHLVDTLPLE